MTRRPTVGVIGLGKVAQLHHLPNLAASPRVDLAVVCDLSRSLATAVADRYGLAPSDAATDLFEVLDRDLDAVVVCNRHHAPVVLQALDAGKHVFVEKPVCWGLDEAVALVNAEQRSGKAVVVGYMKRFDPGFEHLASHGLGESAYYVRLHAFAGGRHRHERLHDILKPTDLTVAETEAEGRAVDCVVAASLDDVDPRRVVAFRTIAELASHDLNLAQTLVGDLTVDVARSFHTPYGRGYLLLMQAAGLPVTLEVVPDFETPRDWDEDLTIFGPAGTTELRLGSPFVADAPAVIHERAAVGLASVVREVLVSRDRPYRREIEHFVDCVIGQAVPRTPLPEAVRDLALVYEACRAMEWM